MKTLDKQNAFNSLSFMAEALIPLIDTLQATNKPQHRLKFHINGMLKELEKLSIEKYRAFKHADLNDKNRQHSFEDIMVITDEAYEVFTNIINQRKANEVVSLITLYKMIVEEGISLEQIKTEYKPIEK